MHIDLLMFSDSIYIRNTLHDLQRLNRLSSSCS